MKIKHLHYILLNLSMTCVAHESATAASKEKCLKHRYWDAFIRATMSMIHQVVSTITSVDGMNTTQNVIINDFNHVNKYDLGYRLHI